MRSRSRPKARIPSTRCSAATAAGCTSAPKSPRSSTSSRWRARSLADLDQGRQAAARHRVHARRKMGVRRVRARQSGLRDRCRNTQGHRPIPAGVRATASRCTQAARRCYVTNGTDGTVNVIDTASNKITHTIKVGQRPWNMALTKDGGKLYVANGRSNNVLGHRYRHEEEGERHRGRRNALGRADSGRALANRVAIRPPPCSTCL